MEVILGTLSEANIKRYGDDWLIVVGLDYGRQKKPYLPTKALLQPFRVIDLIEICGKQSWNDVKTSTIKIKCDYEKLIAIGHAIKEEWIEV